MKFDQVQIQKWFIIFARSLIHLYVFIDIIIFTPV